MDQWEQLRQQCMSCRACGLADTRTNVVFGVGDPRAEVLLVGEAPGEREALEGRPFVGRAGKNLDAFLEGARIRREELYVTNAVKFRPTRASAAGRTVNRPPTQEEIRLFAPWLRREITLVDPQCVVTLGNVPLRAVTEKRLTIGDVHGRLLKAEGRPLFPLYHPASVLYNPSLREIYAADVAALARWLAESKI